LTDFFILKLLLDPVLRDQIKKTHLKMGGSLAKSKPTGEAHGNEHPEKPGLASGSTYTATFL